jgi:hypothetical protein
MEVLQNIVYLPKEDDLLGKRKPQTSIFNADAQYLDKVGRDIFYGFLIWFFGNGNADYRLELRLWYSAVLQHICRRINMDTVAQL